MKVKPGKLGKIGIGPILFPPHLPTRPGPNKRSSAFSLLCPIDRFCARLSFPPFQNTL